jgi:O-antigen ligase
MITALREALIPRAELPAWLNRGQAALLAGGNPAVSAGRFRSNIVLQVLLCVAPAAGLIALGSAQIAALYFWGILAVLFLRLAFLDRPIELLALLIGIAPFANLLREFTLYSIVELLFVGAIVYYYGTASRDLLKVFRAFPFAVWMCVVLCVFYAVSFIFTRAYEINMRVFDLAGVVIVVLILGEDRQRLGAALLGMAITSCAMGLAMLPLLTSGAGGRLGMIISNGHTLGNPVELGVPLALGLLGLVVDRGQWLTLRHSWAFRYSLLSVMVVLLVLTTSRAAWLVVAGGIVCNLLFAKRSRISSFLIIAVGVVAIQALLVTKYGEDLQKGLDRTFGMDRTMDNRTSGRSDQWAVAYYAFTETAPHMLYGYGPGLGQYVYAEYSGRLQWIAYAAGEERAWHSLYLQIAIEAGLIGLLPLLIWLGILAYKNIRWARRTSEMFPLTCLLGFLVVIMTVTGFDTATGTYLGIALLPAVRVRRTARAGTMESRNPYFQWGNTP